MSSDFDPSPRASKRRRTTRYGGQRTILSDDAPDDGAADERSVSHRDESSIANGHTEAAETQDVPTGKLNTGKIAQTSPESSFGRHKIQPHSKSKPLSDLVGTLQDARTSVSPETPSKSVRKARTASSRKGGAEDGSTEVSVNGHSENRTGEQDGEDEPKMEAEDTLSLPRSSGRQRRPPRRLADTLAESARTATTQGPKSRAVRQEPGQSTPVSPALRGILTPSKKPKTGARKSVMFNQDDKEIEEQLGFRDIVAPARPQAKSNTRKATPYPKRSKRTLEVEEELLETSQEKQLESEIEDDVFQDMLVDEPVVNIPTMGVSVRVDMSSKPIDLSEGDPHLQEIKSIVLARLTSTSLPTKAPSHLEKQSSQLHSLLHSTITASESNSLLLLGPRGAGKSMLVNLTLRNLENDHSNDFHIVHLNGFLQTDDRLALREIWRQLGHSRDLDESETEDIGASYADTMASLLSLLSHPDEMAVDPVSNEDMETLAQDASLIASGGQKTAKSIVFVLDEFDLFTTHPRQTLLYNLFDIAQSRKAPIAVIGCSTRMDIIECLEKRVKSRFSHRWLLVPGVKNLVEWNQCVEDALLIDVSEKAQAKRSKEEEKWAESWNSEMKSNFIPSKETQSLIRTHFYTTKSLPDLFLALFPSLAILQIPSSSKPAIPAGITPPTILSTTTELPVLHLSLLAAMSRLETIHHLTASNFNLVHAHYTELIDSTKLRQSAHGSIATSGSLRRWPRGLCRDAWEELGEWGLVVPVTGGRDEESGGQEEDTRMWRCEVGLEDVEWGVRVKFGIDGSEKVGGAGEVLLRWCREV